MRSRSTAGRTLSAIWKITQSRWRRHSRVQRRTSAATTCSSFDLLKRASQREKIREAIQQVTGRVYKLGPYKPPAADGEKPKDPLDAFLHDMREAGVEIEEK